MRGDAVRGGNTGKAARARQLRKVENEAEEALWHEMRGRRLNGHKFVRQLPIGPYFADFACRQSNLVVEVDGSQHAESSRDRFRDETMNRNGWSVLRVWHSDVLTDRNVVLEMIVAALNGQMNKMISHEVKYLPASEPTEFQP
jgi:very-short-patch-repair endonuclease